MSLPEEVTQTCLVPKTFLIEKCNLEESMIYQQEERAACEAPLSGYGASSLDADTDSRQSIDAPTLQKLDI